MKSAASMIRDFAQSVQLADYVLKMLQYNFHDSSKFDLFFSILRYFLFSYQFLMLKVNYVSKGQSNKVVAVIALSFADHRKNFIKRK